MGDAPVTSQIGWNITFFPQNSVTEVREVIEIHFNELLAAVEQVKREVLEILEGEEKQALKQAEGIRVHLEQRCTELKKTQAQMEKLSKNKNDVDFLQVTAPKLNCPLTLCQKVLSAEHQTSPDIWGVFTDAVLRLLIWFCRNIQSGRKKPPTFPCLGSTSAWWTASTPLAASSSTPRRRSAPRSRLPTWKRSKRHARTVRRPDVAGRRQLRPTCQLCVGQVHTCQGYSALWVVAWKLKHQNMLPVASPVTEADRQADRHTSHPLLRAKVTLLSANRYALPTSVCLFLQTKWE